jgi:hypothetical protein
MFSAMLTCQLHLPTPTHFNPVLLRIAYSDISRLHLRTEDCAPERLQGWPSNCFALMESPAKFWLNVFSRPDQPDDTS